ncbi:FUSC family protein [Aeromicrobium sp. IC_218]|uniref:FUSC family protein n=1 Tax=Aeromicrobium sp. IC_218 TaxID=2545468 RepID=UPI00103B461F|nr:FUSC family protein [Aeromicrobium sp. IC_218]TCI97408.1 FUSC family protein [Aeromicrobium sp. IC_218]
MPLPDRFRQLGRDLVAFGPHADAHWVALRAGLTLAVPLVLLWAVDRLDLALAATFGAFTALYGRTHSHRSRTAMQATAGVVLVAAVGLGTAVGTSEHRAWLSVAAMVLVAALAPVVSRACAWHPPGALFPVFAVGATSAHPSTAHDVVLAVLVSAATAVLALVVGRVGLLHGPHRPEPWGVDLRGTLASRRTRTDVAVTALAVGTAAVLATALDLGHAYWAAVGAAAATSGPTAGARVSRAVQRSVGTLAGVVVAAGLLALEPSALVSIVLAIALQVVAELLVGRNYALALVAVTPLALLMVHLAAPSTTAELVGDRVVDTVLGAGVGTLVVVAAALLARRRRA